MNAKFPEVTEADASDKVRGIYEQIKRLRGIPIVPLFYRQLAAFAEDFQWAWGLMEPILCNRELVRAGRRLEKRVCYKTERLPPIDRSVLRLLGVGVEDEQQINSVFSTLNYMNPGNLISVRYLNLCCEAGLGAVEHGGCGSETDSLSVEAKPSALPPLVAVENMPTDLRRVIKQLGVRADPDFVPHLYRHLAHWPAFVGLIATLLFPRIVSGEIDRVAPVFLEAADKEARFLIESLGGRLCEREIPEKTKSRIVALSTRFSQKHPEMLVICSLLQMAMPTEERAM